MKPVTWRERRKKKEEKEKEINVSQVIWLCEVAMHVREAIKSPEENGSTLSGERRKLFHFYLLRVSV